MSKRINRAIKHIKVKKKQDFTRYYMFQYATRIGSASAVVKQPAVIGTYAPFSVYSAQKWATERTKLSTVILCFKEIEKTQYSLLSREYDVIDQENWGKDPENAYNKAIQSVIDKTNDNDQTALQKFILMLKGALSL